MFFPEIGISTFPTEIKLCEDETEGISTYFTSTFDLEKSDEGFSSSFIDGSLGVITHFSASLLTYPSLVR